MTLIFMLYAFMSHNFLCELPRVLALALCTFLTTHKSGWPFNNFFTHLMCIEMGLVIGDVWFFESKKNIFGYFVEFSTFWNISVHFAEFRSSLIFCWIQNFKKSFNFAEFSTFVAEKWQCSKNPIPKWTSFVNDLKNIHLKLFYLWLVTRHFNDKSCEAIWWLFLWKFSTKKIHFCGLKKSFKIWYEKNKYFYDDDKNLWGEERNMLHCTLFIYYYNFTQIDFWSDS